MQEPLSVAAFSQTVKEAEEAGKLGAVTISTNMAGRGTDIMLGGNPEYMAKKEMRKMEIPEDLIAMATGTVEIDDEDVKAAIAEREHTHENVMNVLKARIRKLKNER